MVNLKKCVSLLLVLFLLFANSLVLAQETKTEIPFENSLYVLGSTSELVDFTESDFVGVDCQRVFMFSKEYDTSEKIYYYEFIVVLNQTGKKARAEATRQLEQLSFVNEVQENMYAEFSLTMETSPIVLKKGENCVLEYSAGGLAKLFANRFLVTFEVDPQVLDESTLTKDTFAHFGIMDYWPLTSDAVWKSKPFPFEFSVSPYHRYCTKVEFGEKGNGFETLDSLIRMAGIAQVAVFTDMITGVDYGFYFKSNNPSVVDLQNNGEEQVAVVTGKSSGKGSVSFYYGENQVTTRDVFVYELGDVNGDTKIDAKDALRVLKYAVSKCPIEEWEACAAEVDGKDGINAKDALEILKYSVKKITKFPIEEIVITPTDVTPTGK